MTTSHTNVTPADITGEVPVQKFGILGGREDWDGDRGWDGCLDAPELLPAGGVVAVYIDPAVGGMGWEGNAARNKARELYCA